MLHSLGYSTQKEIRPSNGVDPERDTPERIDSYLSSFDPRILGLVGSPQALTDVPRRYRAYTAKRTDTPHAEHYSIDHSAVIYLIDPQNRIRALIPSSAGPREIAQQILDRFREVHRASVPRV